MSLNPTPPRSLVAWPRPLLLPLSGVFVRLAADQLLFAPVMVGGFISLLMCAEVRQHYLVI